MPSSIAFDPVSAGAGNNIGQDPGGVIGVTKATVIGESLDLRVGQVSPHDRPQVLNLRGVCRFRRDAVFAQ